MKEKHPDQALLVLDGILMTLLEFKFADGVTNELYEEVREKVYASLTRATGWKVEELDAVLEERVERGLANDDGCVRIPSA